MDKEEYIGSAKLSEQLKKGKKLVLKDGAVKEKHIADDAITTPKIKDKAVTPSKRSDDFDNVVVKPYVNDLDNKYDTITNEIDGKYNSVTEELHSMIASLQVGGIALSGKFGNRTDIGIHQKALTKAIGRLWDELGTITGKTYMDFILTVQPTIIVGEGIGTVTVTANCSESISDFDSIKFYVNNILKAESHDVSIYTQNLSIEDDGVSTIKAEGVIMGKTIIKEMQVTKAFPFFMGGGQNYQDVMTPEFAKELVGTLEGDYDVRIPHNGDYMFIIFPISHRDEFRRADMNGYEIPFTRQDTADYVILKSENTYNQGVYNVDIDINS